jgi:hypothetical protein
MTAQTPSYIKNTLLGTGQAPNAITPLRMQDIADSFAAILFSYNTQTASYTLVLTDGSNTKVLMNVSSANNLTVPTNATVPFPVGTVIPFAQIGTGTTTLSAAVGVTLNYPSSLTTRARYSSGSIEQISANTWLVSGDMT